MRRNNAPIYCSRCDNLALANLEGDPLCPHCLVSAVKRCTDASILEQISPLSISTATISYLVKCEAVTYKARTPVKKAIVSAGSYKY